MNDALFQTKVKCLDKILIHVLSATYVFFAWKTKQAHKFDSARLFTLITATAIDIGKPARTRAVRITMRVRDSVFYFETKSR
jgi:hypothetical protein